MRLRARRSSMLAYVRDDGATAPNEVVERLKGATIAITNKVALRAERRCSNCRI